MSTDKEGLKEGVERRFCKVEEFRANTNKDGTVTLEGLAAVFNAESNNLGWFTEIILPSAFDNILGSSDCRSLFNHDPNLILGRESAGTLRLEKRDNGLWMSVDLPGTQYAKDLAVSVGRGDIREQSFCFIVKTDAWSYDRDTGQETRTIVDVRELIDVSPVTFPAYDDTTVAKRSLERFKSAENSGDDNGPANRAVDKKIEEIELELMERNI